MPIPATIDDLSTNPSSNSPSGSDSPTEGDNYLRAIQAIIKQEHDYLGTASTATAGAGRVGYDASINYTDGLGQFLNYTFGRTAAEVSASITPTNYAYVQGDPRRYGATFDGVTVDTTGIQSALTVAGVSKIPVLLPPGTAIIGQITIPSGVAVLGRGKGVTILKLNSSANADVIRNSGYGGSGASNITLRDFTVDGNYTAQTGSPHGINLDNVDDAFIDNVEVKNARGTGIVLTNCDGVTLGPGMWVRSCGKATAGYGVYNFCSDNLTVIGGDYDDNCIGIAIEASGSGLHSNNCMVIGSRGASNRADFSQSGALVHFEQSSSGECLNGYVSGIVVNGGTGVGINNTACALTIQGALIYNTTKTGVSTSNAVGINYDGIRIINCGAGDSPGYQAAMRFDDSGISPATSGSVTNCYARGSTTDGFKTLSVNSAVKFSDNDVSGFTNDYSLSSTADLVKRFESNQEASITYSASMTPVAAAGRTQLIVVSNGTAFTINAPTGGFKGQYLTFRIKNGAGGVLGTATWNAIYKMASWTQPGSGNSRSITFEYDGTNWIEIARNASDIPN